MMHVVNVIPTPENIEFDILIKGKPIKQFKHNHNLYVEGRKGSNYSLKVTNNNLCRVLAVISVDGLNVTDGKPASEKSQGWVIEAHSSVTIPGWLVDNANAAQFKFEGKSNSYAVNSDNNPNNVGVIGCMIIKQKPLKLNQDWNTNPWPFPKTPVYPETPGNIWQPYFTCNNIYNPTFNPSCSTRSTAINQAVCDVRYKDAGPLMGSSSANCSYSAQPEENLGTAFGSRTDFKTTETAFERDGIIKTFVIYYDNKQALERIGIVFSKKAVKLPVAPNPFPASEKFCTPPKGWEDENPKSFRIRGRRGEFQ